MYILHNDARISIPIIIAYNKFAGVTLTTPNPILSLSKRSSNRHKCSHYSNRLFSLLTTAFVEASNFTVLCIDSLAMKFRQAIESTRLFCTGQDLFLVHCSSGLKQVALNKRRF